VYQGGHDPVLRRVGERDTVQINVTAHEAFGFAGAGGDAFTVLDDLAAALTGGDTAAIAGALEQVDGALRTLGGAQAKVGVSTNRVESALGRTEDALHALRSQLAEVQDVDIAHAVMDLQVQEVAYQATLAALGRALPPSLAAFLR
jgi:flagellar hook-associated protein 3 FlgL